MHFPHRAAITSIAGILLACSFPCHAAAEPLIQYGGSPSAYFSSPDLAIGWHQSSSTQGVTISATLGLYQSTSRSSDATRIATAYLTTALGPGTNSGNLVSTNTVLVGGSPNTSSAYTLFSGLNLSPGSYYLTISEGNDVGWLTSSSPSLYQASGDSYLGAFSADLTRGTVDPY